MELSNKLRNILGNAIMFCGILVLVLGTILLYIGAWFAGSPLKVAVDDLSTDDLKKFYREQADRDKEGL